MNNLSNSVYNYYIRHFDELSFDKQLHFSSRLFLWSGDEFGRKKLDELRSQVTMLENPKDALQSVYDTAQATIHHGSKNAAELRAPYFEKYPEIRTVAMLLFRLTFLKTIYGIDARDELAEIIDIAATERLLTRVLEDEEAIAILSTHAINVLYLFNRIYRDDETAFDPKYFMEIAHHNYDLQNPMHIQLYIYLYTHCIIGESQFYARRLPATHLATYLQMLDELEQIIEERFDDINLDNKFEFLVCCKLAGKTSTLAGRIEDEASRSVSDAGTFLVDRHNNNPQLANNNLDLSEHRNVLYILSHTKPRH